MMIDANADTAADRAQITADEFMTLAAKHGFDAATAQFLWLCRPSDDVTARVAELTLANVKADTDLMAGLAIVRSVLGKLADGQTPSE